MYRNLKAELARLNISQKELQSLLNIGSLSTINLKINGKSIITLNEAKLIRNLINKKSGNNLSIDYLFEI